MPNRQSQTDGMGRVAKQAPQWISGVCSLLLIDGCWAMSGIFHPTARKVQLEYFARVARATYSHRGEGCIDVETLLFVLKASFERRRRKGALVDVGANIGRTLLAMTSVFEKRMWAHYVDIPGGCSDSTEPLTLYAFEPNPGTFAELERTTKQFAGRHRVQLVRAAVSNVSGRHSLFFRHSGDEISSLSKETISNDNAIMSVMVDVVTLDDFLPPNAEVHLMKIDVEGFDPLAIQGANRLLQRRRVKFLVFEVGHKWSLAGHGISLQQVVTEFFSKGYACFLMARVALLPLSGSWWQDLYEDFTWANIFCGLLSDHDLFDAYVAYGTNNHTLSYALSDLRVGRGRA